MRVLCVSELLHYYKNMCMHLRGREGRNTQCFDLLACLLAFLSEVACFFFFFCASTRGTRNRHGRQHRALQLPGPSAHRPRPARPPRRRAAPRALPVPERSRKGTLRRLHRGHLPPAPARVDGALGPPAQEGERGRGTGHAVRVRRHPRGVPRDGRERRDARPRAHVQPRARPPWSNTSRLCSIPPGHTHTLSTPRTHARAAGAAARRRLVRQELRPLAAGDRPPRVLLRAAASPVGAARRAGGERRGGRSEPAPRRRAGGGGGGRGAPRSRAALHARGLRGDSRGAGDGGALQARPRAARARSAAPAVQGLAAAAAQLPARGQRGGGHDGVRPTRGTPSNRRFLLCPVARYRMRCRALPCAARR